MSMQDNEAQQGISELRAILDDGRWDDMTPAEQKQLMARGIDQLQEMLEVIETQSQQLRKQEADLQKVYNSVKAMKAKAPGSSRRH